MRISSFLLSLAIPPIAMADCQAQQIQSTGLKSNSPAAGENIVIHEADPLAGEVSWDDETQLSVYRKDPGYISPKRNYYQVLSTMENLAMDWLFCGVVFNSEKKQLPGVTVMNSRKRSGYETATNSMGEFALSSSRRGDTITLTHPEYHPIYVVISNQTQAVFYLKRKRSM